MRVFRELALAVVMIMLSVPAWAADCSRECLMNLADTYIAALAAHDPGKVPFAKSVAFVENLQHLKLGDGLWKTASSGATKFKIFVPDPVSQQVGGIVMMAESGKPIELGFRLKLDDGKVVEAEHIVARDLRETSLPNLQKPRGPFLQKVPEDYADSRERLIAIAKSYYDALDLNNGDLAPFADDCVRMENGRQTARTPVTTDANGHLDYHSLGCAAQLDTQVMSYIDTIDNRRVEIADPVTGLAIGFSHFRQSMKTHKFRVIGIPGEDYRTINLDPYDLPATHIFKIWGGKIHEIEALGYFAPYNSPTVFDK